MFIKLKFAQQGMNMSLLEIVFLSCIYIKLFKNDDKKHKNIYFVFFYFAGKGDAE